MLRAVQAHAPSSCMHLGEMLCAEPMTASVVENPCEQSVDLDTPPLCVSLSRNGVLRRQASLQETARPVGLARDRPVTSAADVAMPGLQNETGEYNCFLNVHHPVPLALQRLPGRRHVAAA